MKSNFLPAFIFICLLLQGLSFRAASQIVKPLNFGQSELDTMQTQSSTFTYTTPEVNPIDVIFVRAKGYVQINMELIAPSGAVVQSLEGRFNELVQIIYRIPSDGEAGVYKILISNKGIWNDEFCIALERMNEPPGAAFLSCNSSLTGKIDCFSTIQSFRYLVQEGTVSRITVSPNPIAPEAWVCDAQGIILRYGKAGFNQQLVLDTIPATQTGCYYIFVADADAFWRNGFSVSQTILSGACAAGVFQTIPANASPCIGDSLVLQGSSPYSNATYSWTGPNGFFSTESRIVFPEATADLAGKYVLTVTVPGLCNSVVEKTVTVNPLPVLTFIATPGNGKVCEGQNFSIRANSNTVLSAVQWLGPNSYSSNSISFTISRATVDRTGIYTFFGTDRNGCKNSISADILVSPLPMAEIAEPASNYVCLGQPLLLLAATDSDNPVFSWAGPNGFVSSEQNPVFPSSTLAMSGTYRLTVTDAISSCSNSDSETVLVRTLPTATIFGNFSICTGDSTELSAFGGSFFSWSNGSTASKITVKPLVATVYRLTVTDSYGCQDSETITVEVKPLPEVAIASTPAVPEICSGTGSIVLCATTNAESPEFSWSGAAFFSTLQCVSFNTTSQTGIYRLAVRDSRTGCFGRDTIPIAIYASPVVDILPTPQGTYCEGDNLILCANSNASRPGFQWSGPSGFSSNSLCVALNNVQATMAGNYSVTITDIHGCRGSKNYILDVNPKPNGEISGDLNICEGTETQLTASGGSTYRWSTGANSVSIRVSPSARTTYDVVVTNIFGCKDTASATVAVIPNDLELNLQADGKNIQASMNGGTPPFRFSIVPSVLPPNNDGLFSNLPLGTYTVTAIDANGCSTSKTLSLTTAVVEPQKEWGVMVFPNPSRGLVHISRANFTGSELRVDLYDPAGERIRQMAMEDVKTSVDWGDLPAGFYLLRFSDGRKTGAIPLVLIK